MRIKFLIFCLGLAIMTNCKKLETSGPSSINGQVIDKTTGRGVPYAQVFVIGSSSGSLGGALGNQQNGYTTADGNGNYSINFNWANGNYYNVTATAPLYYQGLAVSTISINEGKNNNVTIPIVPQGFVRFHIVPTYQCSDIGLYGMVSGFYDIYYPKDAYVVDMGYGNIKNVVMHKIYYADSLKIYYDTIFVPEFDTINYTINY